MSVDRDALRKLFGEGIKGISRNDIEIMATNWDKFENPLAQSTQTFQTALIQAVLPIIAPIRLNQIVRREPVNAVRLSAMEALRSTGRNLNIGSAQTPYTEQFEAFAYTMPPMNGEIGKNRVICYFPLYCPFFPIISEAELEREFAVRNLEPANPRLHLADNQPNGAFTDHKHPSISFWDNSFWDNGSGRVYLTMWQHEGWQLSLGERPPLTPIWWWAGVEKS